MVLIADEDRLNSTQLLSKVIAEDINRIVVPFVALQYLPGRATHRRSAQELARSVHQRRTIAHHTGYFGLIQTTAQVAVSAINTARRKAM